MSTITQSLDIGSATMGGVRVHLHLNGLALLIASIAAYAMRGYGWGLFALLLFVPDIFMLGYLVNTRVGAVVYNAGHSLLLPLAWAGIGQLTGSPDLFLQIGLIHMAHIGLDRLLGYGYKYPGAFTDTDIARA